MAFLILVIGDLHIPDRALDIPAKVRQTAYLLLLPPLLHYTGRQCLHARAASRSSSPGKIGQTLCLGNLTDKHTYEYLRSIAPDLKIVKGRFDVEATSLPLSQVVTHGSLRVGFVEGFTLVSTEPDLLLAEANKLDVDVLCWGGTHRFDAFEYMDKFFVNPGSATGAYTTGWTKEGEEMVPSFCLMDVQGISLTLYVYQLRKDANGVENVAVEKVTYTKPVEPTAPSS
ncbi:MJ0936 family phosphodiesterase [Apiospora arundinis]